MEINAKSGVYCVIGNPIEHSLSPALHNAAFQSAGINNVYTAFCVSDIENAIHGFRALNIKGVSVTIPHKVTAIPFLDEIDPVAENIGAINTIINKNGKLTGYNSDGFGALKAFSEAGIDITEKKVAIIGSGGAARAIAFTLAMETKPLELNVLGIEVDQINHLARDLNQKTSQTVTGIIMDGEAWEQKIIEADILLHCTPIGMYPKIDDCVIPERLLHPGLVVFDIVYTPLVTKLLQLAEQAGCSTIRGVEMFINQAAIQFELWTGKPAPVDVFRKEMEKHLTQ